MNLQHSQGAEMIEIGGDTRNVLNSVLGNGYTRNSDAIIEVISYLPQIGVKKNDNRSLEESMIRNSSLLLMFKAYNSGVLIVITVGICTKIFLFISILRTTFAILVGISLLLGSISVLPAWYINHKRMKLPTLPHDTMLLDQCSSITARYSVVTMMLGISALVVEIISDHYQHTFANSLISVTELCTMMFLCFNLFFLILDVKVSSLLLDQLALLVERKQLTLEQLDQVRNEVTRRAREASWASDVIIVPCIVSAITIMLSVVLIDKKKSVAAKLDLLGFLLMLLKEILFVGVAFGYVAQVNAKADELTVRLSKLRWGPLLLLQPALPTLPTLPAVYPPLSTSPTPHPHPSSTSAPAVAAPVRTSSSTATANHHSSSSTSQVLESNMSSYSSSTAAAAASVNHSSSMATGKNTNGQATDTFDHTKELFLKWAHPDLERLSLYASSSAAPITFTLLFKRVTWEYVLISAAGFCLTTLLGVVRGIAGF
jgi:hypothetical protein